MKHLNPRFLILVSPQYARVRSGKRTRSFRIQGTKITQRASGKNCVAHCRKVNGTARSLLVGDFEGVNIDGCHNGVIFVVVVVVILFIFIVGSKVVD